MNEAETRAEHIDPALKAAGWGVVEGSRVMREYRITEGRLQGAGQRAKPEIADYVLVYRNHKLAVVEAKRWDAPHTEGLAQAKAYAGKLRARFGYATNGQRIYGVDMHSGAEGEVDAYPSPEELWNRTFAEANDWRERFAAVPFEDKGGLWGSRYYQDSAINAVLEAIADNRQRILLTLATGTGKTFIAFQLAWKLFHARWNQSYRLSPPVRPEVSKGETIVADSVQASIPQPERITGGINRRPRILFLADRNILADQAYNAFSAFPEDALVRVAPEDIRKKGRVPKNGSVFFTIFQTFMSGPSTNIVRAATVDSYSVRPEPVEGLRSSIHGSTSSPRTEERAFYFGEYPPDFFDFIVIDECHRGGANDESTWRGTRLYEGKEYFTIYDFVKAHHLFNDPEWDGDPIEVSEGGDKAFPPIASNPPPEAKQPRAEYEAKKKVRVKLRDGKERSIRHISVTTFWGPDGKPISAAEFLTLLFGQLPEFFRDEDELRALWSLPDTRKKLLEGLAEKGFGKEQLGEMQKIIDAENSDLFDVLAHVAFAMQPISREERASAAHREVHERFSDKQQAFLDFVLAHYVQEGVEELEQEKLTKLLRLKYHDSIPDAVADLGGDINAIRNLFSGFQRYLYQGICAQGA